MQPLKESWSEWTSNQAPAPAPATVAVSGLPAGVPAQVSLLTPPGAATPVPSSGQAPPFETVTRGADRIDGVLPLWKKQDKVWVELAPADFGRPFFLSPKLRTGLGEGGFFGGLLASRNAQIGRPQWVEFRRVNQQVQLIAINASFTATPGTPQALAVQDAFSPSLLASVTVASQPRSSDNKVLVELSSLMSGDLLGLGLQLQRTFRQGYALDARNSGVTQARATPSGLLLEMQQHYATGSLTSASPSAGPQPSIPTALPDPRSLFLSVQYTLSPLPAQPMAPRLADARIGHFTSTVADFTNDLARTPRIRYVNRWRLEKKDPQAPLSEPVRPLVFWLDRNIPDDYRPTIREAVLAWNSAFEAIGFKNAIQVRDATAELPQDIVGNGQAMVRWMTNAQPTFGAIGPSHVDPRTGEILTAEIALESLSTRAIRAIRSQLFSDPGEKPLAASPVETVPPGPASSTWVPAEDRCDHAELAAEQMAYGLDVWALTHDVPGDLPPDSAEVKSFVLAYLRDTTMHEVGHALGLRHNFKASRWRTPAQLLDAKLTARDGNSASVMDYAAINMSAPGQPPVTPFQTTLGPYDYWAIEYAYKPLAGTPAEEKTKLDAIARRSADPKQAYALAYGTDEDNALGLDPEALVFDLGRDPVAFARTRLAIARDLIARQTTAHLSPTDDAAVLRRRVGYALRDVERTADILTRQIGGLITRRGTAASGLDALDPLPSDTQRAALTLLLDQILSPRSIHLPAALQRRLAPDYLERSESLFPGGGVSPTDFSAAVQLGVLQRSVLSDLMADSLADRLLDNIDKTRDRDAHPLTLGEFHQRLRETIWAKPSQPQEAAVPPPWRRNLQRDHINRLTVALLRGANRADVRAQLRLQAEQLASMLSHPGALGSKDPKSVAEAHRRDCLDTLRRALDASVVRNTP
ncbi:MAG TPA: zinc-dependent metalloprotease [Candidatus Aquabacterium excrementipullorum]|nr:zinc-dependent metalloprotease [Candidatus Aquabacterium excrementipullorum]